MSYLVCYECNQYYEVESFEHAADMELTHCECGRELVYFENLEDSYTETDIVDEPVTDVDYRYEEEALDLSGRVWQMVQHTLRKRLHNKNRT